MSYSIPFKTLKNVSLAVYVDKTWMHFDDPETVEEGGVEYVAVAPLFSAFKNRLGRKDWKALRKIARRLPQR